MKSFGVDMVIVSDGRRAVEAWQAGDFDLVFMDIQMPVLDGIAATREIRVIERRTGRPATRIIALSANVMTHQIAEYLAAGMDGYVPKPIAIESLYDALAEVAHPPVRRAARGA
jgi:CheY-like chemotaxis protein